MNDITQTDSLDVLAEIKPEIVPTRSYTYTIEPIRMGKLKQFAALAMPMIHEVMDFMEQQGDIVALIEKHEQSIIGLLELCSDFKQDHYDNMLPDEFTALVLAIIEVNTDFFVRSLLPKLKGRIEIMKSKLEQAKQAHGLTQSSASLVKATTKKK